MTALVVLNSCEMHKKLTRYVIYPMWSTRALNVHVMFNIPAQVSRSGSGAELSAFVWALGRGNRESISIEAGCALLGAVLSAGMGSLSSSMPALPPSAACFSAARVAHFFSCFFRYSHSPYSSGTCRTHVLLAQRGLRLPTRACGTYLRHLHTQHAKRCAETEHRHQIRLARAQRKHDCAAFTCMRMHTHTTFRMHA